MRDVPDGSDLAWVCSRGVPAEYKGVLAKSGTVTIVLALVPAKSGAAVSVLAFVLAKSGAVVSVLAE